MPPAVRVMYERTRAAKRFVDIINSEKYGVRQPSVNDYHRVPSTINTYTRHRRVYCARVHTCGRRDLNRCSDFTFQPLPTRRYIMLHDSSDAFCVC